jgi:TM2 domain-containing membrane protein YozV
MERLSTEEKILLIYSFIWGIVCLIPMFYCNDLINLIVIFLSVNEGILLERLNNKRKSRKPLD